MIVFLFFFFFFFSSRRRHTRLQGDWSSDVCSSDLQATSKWCKEERHGVFLVYNQNAKDRTVASAWSVRPTPDARVSMPLTWDEVADCDPAAFTLVTAPTRMAERGDAAAGIDGAAGSL